MTNNCFMDMQRQIGILVCPNPLPPFILAEAKWKLSLTMSFSLIVLNSVV